MCERLDRLSLREVDFGQMVVQPPGQSGMLRLSFAKDAQGTLILAGSDADLDDSLIRAGGFFAQIRMVDGAEVQRRLRVVQNPDHFHESGHGLVVILRLLAQVVNVTMTALGGTSVDVVDSIEPTLQKYGVKKPFYGARFPGEG